MKKCKYCGKEFVPSNNNQKYCSWNCYQDAKGTGKHEKSLQTYTCAWCGKEFTYDRKKKYCSEECRLKACRRLKPKAEKKQPKKSITEIAVEARKLNMSYGQYVAKFGL